MATQLTPHIVLVKTPRGVPYVLQKGSGSNFSVEQQQISSGKDLLFTCVVGTKPGRDGQPDFIGLYVQGAARERFVYIGIGKFAGSRGSPWERRLKVPLRGITQAMTSIVTHIDATDKMGGPSCAMPKLFAGWANYDASVKNP